MRSCMNGPVRVTVRAEKRLRAGIDIESLRARERRLLEQAGWGPIELVVEPEEEEMEHDDR